MKLSAHFTLEELTTSREAIAKGINNDPDEGAMYNMKAVLTPGCEQARLILNSSSMIVTSCYRSPELNCITNGAMTVDSLENVRMSSPLAFVREYAARRMRNGSISRSNSQHMLGLAMDFISPKFGSPWDVCQALVNSGLNFDQIIYEYGRWCHLSFAPNPRRVVLTKLSGQPYRPGLHKE